jgi:protein-tyrosine phosphatase
MTDWPGERGRNGGVDEIPLGTSPGRLWLCGKHFVGPDPEGALHRAGAGTIVCLTERGELEGRYPAYVDWLQENQPVRAVWCPVPDFHVPDVATARLLLADLGGRLQRGDGLLVHCGAGIGRSGTMAAALLVTLGATPDEAVAVVAANRVGAGPEVGAQWDLLRALATP